MNNLAKVYVFKISATVLVWSLPLILLSASAIESAGFPEQPSYMFVRMLGWAYLALCVGYAFGLAGALKGERMPGPIWVGIISNAGAFCYLLYYGTVGTWNDWGLIIQIIGWGSVTATFAIIAGLVVFGVLSDDEGAA